MSHEKVKKIRIENGKVLITSKSNNDTEPIKEWHCVSLTETLKEQGETALNIEILKAYESGEFQGAENKYSRAIDTLRYLPEYEKYNWRNKYNGNKEMDAQIEANRQSEAFEQLLLNALKLNKPKATLVITKLNEYDTTQTIYLWKKTTRQVKWTADKAKAKKFAFEQEIERLKNCFIGGDKWNITTI